MHPIDWAMVVLYAVSTLGLGYYSSRKQDSTADYFLGGGNLNPILVGVSLFATLLSTISYLSMPGEAVGKGPVFFVSIVALPFAYLIVSRLLLPAYMQHRVTSAYELLEARLGLGIRLTAATMFLALRLVWMMLLIYLAAKAMVIMWGLDVRWTSTVVMITGIVAVAYTSMGGLRAVVITDLMQTILLLGGALFVIASVTIQMGGFSWFPTTWQPTWDTQPVVSLNPKTRVTMVGGILTVLTWTLATMGGDQTSVQRFMATRDLTAARRAMATQMTVNVVVHIVLFVVGLALLAFYTTYTDRLPTGGTVKSLADDLFPHYISHELPIGVTGLVVAAMFAAAMSSIDSGVNSITAVVMTDYFERLGFGPRGDASRMRWAKVMALTIGIIVIMGSTMMRYIEGNITAVTNKTVNLLATPIFALFVYAVVLKRITRVGVWAGTLCGVVTAASIAFSGPLVYLLHQQFGLDLGSVGVELLTRTDPVSGATWTTAEDPISFQWIGPVALTVNLLVGIGVSRLILSVRPTAR